MPIFIVMPWSPFVSIALGFLLGSVPFALLLGRMAGVDLRTVGSGNIGAGNLTRQAGLGYGLPAAVLDGLKGLVPVLVAESLGFAPAVAVAGGLAAVIGHNWSVYLRARAGRGLATAVGVLVAVAPQLLVWPGMWAVAGWWIGGGFGGFFGWGLLGLVAVVSGQPAVAVGTAATVSVIVMLRRMQGNPGAGRDLRSRLHRVVWDTDRVVAEKYGALS